jgi:hypothetical protein
MWEQVHHARNSSIKGGGECITDIRTARHHAQHGRRHEKFNVSSPE